MAITTRDGLVAALAGAQKFNFYKPSMTAEGAGTWQSLWKAAGFPAAGATPPAYTAGSGYNMYTSTLGAFSTFQNPSGSNTEYLLQAALGGATVGRLIIYDRVWACAGMQLNASGTLTVTTPGNPTRPAATGLGLEAWGEIYSAPGATGATWTLNYLDEDGHAASSSYTHPANAETVGQMFPFPLQAGDLGVSQVVSVYLSAASGALGELGITLVRRLAEIPITIANVGDIYDAFYLGMPQIYPNACLAFMVQASTTSTGVMIGSFNTGEG